MRKTNTELLHYWNYTIDTAKKENYAMLFEVDETGDHCCIFLDDEKREIVTCYNGSDKAKEWLGNLDFFPPKEGRSFHNNFYTIAELFVDQLKPYYRDLQGVLPGWKHKLVHHSRGSGIGVIAHYMMVRYLNTPTENIESISFGSPRLATARRGIRKLANANLAVHRVTIDRDPVDNLPPRLTPLPYPIAWDHYETELYELPTVKGKFDHLAFGEALKQS